MNIKEKLLNKKNSIYKGDAGNGMVFVVILVLMVIAIAFTLTGGQLPQLDNKRIGSPVVLVTSSPQNAKNNLQLYTFIGLTITPSPSPAPVPIPTPTIFQTTPALTPTPSCAPTGTVKAATTQSYYVSPTGNDANDGLSPGTPKATFSFFDSLIPGDTVYLMDGTWTGKTIVFNRSGTAAQHITLTNYPGAHPILDGNWAGNGITIYGSSLGYIDISGIEITRYSSGIYLRDTKNIQVSNMKIHYLTGMAIGFTDTVDSSIKNSELYDVATGNIVQLDEASRQMYNIVVEGNTIHDSPGTLFPPCIPATGENCGHGGIDLLDESSSNYFTNIWLVNNTIYNINSNPIYMHISSGNSAAWTNIHIVGNTMYNFGCHAQLIYMHDSFVENNYIHDSKSSACGNGIYSYWDHNLQVENTLFSGNRIEKTIGPQIYIHDSSNNRYEKNCIAEYILSGNSTITDPASANFTANPTSGTIKLQTTTGQTFTVDGTNRGSSYTIPSGSTDHTVNVTGGTGSYSCTASVPPPPPPPPPATPTPPACVASTPIWSDEFNGASLDTSVWTARTDGSDCITQQAGFSPSNAYLDGTGNLVVKAERATQGSCSFRSAEILSKQKYTYGYVEYRVKLPQGGQGIFPAVWLIADYTSTLWTPEIDVLENINDMSIAHMTYHYGLRSNHLQDSSTYQNPTLAAGYHTYAVDWTPTYIKWYIDGVLQKTHTNSGPNDITATPMHLDIDMYLGGSWAGAVGGSTVLPQYMYVDYVRVYNKMPASCSLPPSC